MRGQTSVARLDASKAQAQLGWTPESDPGVILAKGVTDPVTAYIP